MNSSFVSLGSSKKSEADLTAQSMTDWLIPWFITCKIDQSSEIWTGKQAVFVPLKLRIWQGFMERQQIKFFSENKIWQATEGWNVHSTPKLPMTDQASYNLPFKVQKWSPQWVESLMEILTIAMKTEGQDVNGSSSQLFVSVSMQLRDNVELILLADSHRQIRGVVKGFSYAPNLTQLKASDLEPKVQM